MGGFGNFSRDSMQNSKIGRRQRIFRLQLVSFIFNSCIHYVFSFFFLQFSDSKNDFRGEIDKVSIAFNSLMRQCIKLLFFDIIEVKL